MNLDMALTNMYNTNFAIQTVFRFMHELILCKFNCRTDELIIKMTDKTLTFTGQVNSMDLEITTKLRLFFFFFLNW
jgi:hypothetical protein